MRFYALAERPLIEEGGQQVRGLPPGAIGAVDLAPVSGTSHVFVTSDQPLNGEDVAVSIGDGSRLNDYRPDAKERSAWKRLVGVSIPAGTTLLDTLWQTLTAEADPDGELRAKPIMPTHRGVLELHLGGHSLIRAEKMPKDPTKHPAWPAIQRVMQNSHKKIRERDPEIARKWLGDKRRTYRLKPEAARDLIARPGRREDLPQRPTTSLADDFSRTDGELSGTGPSGAGWVWAVSILGDWEIVSGVLKNPGGVDDIAWPDTDLSSENHFCQADGPNAGNTVSCLTRWDSTNIFSETHMMGRIDIGGANDAQIHKRVSGSFTLLGSESGHASPATVRLSSDGSSHDLLVDGSSVLTVTDTSITGNLRVGFRGIGSDFDNFHAEDLLSGSTLVRDVVQGGYAAAVGHVGEPATGDLVNPAALVAALRAGWTLAEALAVATPKVNSNVRMIGDPLARLPLPLQGYNVYSRPTFGGDDELIGVGPAGSTSIDLTGFLDSSRQLLSVRSVSKCGVEDDEAYRPRVAQFDDAGDLANVTPNPVIDLQLDQSAGTVTATWNYRKNGQQATPDQFQVYVATGATAFDFGSIDHTLSGAARRQQTQSLGSFSHGTKVRVAVEVAGAAGNASPRRFAELVVDAQAPDAPQPITVEVTRE